MGNRKADPAILMMEATLQGFAQAKAAMDQMKETQQAVAIATYKGMTSSGKSRYVAELVQTLGSQSEAAGFLKLTPGRISQLVGSEKNKANGR